MTAGTGTSRVTGQSLVTRVRAALITLGAVSPGHVVLVGVSGGPDSLTLLHVLREISRDAGFSVHAAHFDHGLRGAQSAEESNAVADIAARWGVPCAIERAQEGSISSRGMGLQAAARAARYEFFDRVADAVNARWIATAHTADDQAETVLMRWLRGAGPSALAGIPAVRGRVIRPLLGVTRAQIEAYAAERGLTPVQDPSNRDPRFLRARVRRSVMPALRAMNPRAVETMARSAALLAEDAAWLDDQGRAALAESTSGVGSGGIELDASRLVAVPTVIRRRALRFALEGLGVRVDRVSAERLDAAARGCVERTSGSLTLGQGASAEYGAGLVRLARGTKPPPPPSAVLHEGENRPPGWGVVVRVRRTAPVASPEPSDPWRSAFDIERLPGMLGLRSWRAGDRLYPEGMTGSKLVHDVFTDAKVPRWRRASAPLVTAGDEVVWVVGLRRDRRYTARPGAPTIEVSVVPELTAGPGIGIRRPDPTHLHAPPNESLTRYDMKGVRS
ncbi:MAG: tRNA lysidine(34) synthetase TilS [Nitrospirota bacterium]